MAWRSFCLKHHGRRRMNRKRNTICILESFSASLGSTLSTRPLHCVSWPECGCLYQEAGRAGLSTSLSTDPGSVLTRQPLMHKALGSFVFFITCLIHFLSVYKRLRFIPDFIFAFCIHFLGKMVKEGCDKETGQLLSFQTIQSLTVGHPLGRFATLDGQLSRGQRSNLIWKLVLIFNLLTW